MGRFVGDPDFTLRWPEAVLRDELRRLIVVGERDGPDSNWADEIELLLRQAFSSAVPAEDFRKVMDKGPTVEKGRAYDDEEPF